MFEHANFKQAILFKDQAFGTGTNTTFETPALELGNMQQGIAVRAYLDAPVGAASGNTFTVTVLDCAEADGTYGTYASKTYTASGTSIAAGDLFSIPLDSTKAYMKVAVAHSSGMTGKFTVAEEYVAR